MERTEFVILIHQAVGYSNDAAEALLEEYDRLTALNAQLLEACIELNNLFEKHNRYLRGQVWRDFSDLQDMAQAAIRAAGEEHA